MNQVKDLFNTQFFVILGVVLLLVTCLVLYVEQKFKAYDHKMSSMLSLVSSLAEEMDILKNNRNHSGGQSEIQTEINNLNENLEESKLIDVSDDDDDDDDETNNGSDSESDDANNLDSDSDDDSDDEPETDSESVDDLNVPKIVNTIDLGSNENEIITITKLEDLQSNNIVELNESNIEELDDIEKKYDLEDLDDSNDLDDLDDLDDLYDLDETNVVEELDDDIEETNVVEELDDDMDETNVVEELNDDAIDYNKLSVAKLKEIAMDKNLILNTNNKLKKAELLKLLEGN